MIEIEKKIEITEKEEQTIRQKALFVKDHTFTDTYFDKKDYHFTRQNMWLRRREMKFELKTAVKGSDGKIDRYEEVTEENLIATRLGLDPSISLEESLYKAEIIPFCTFTTSRRKYQIEDFSLDLDIADFGDFVYRVGEIELLVETESNIHEAESRIHNLMESLSIPDRKIVQAKLSIYLKQKRPDHYAALLQAGVIKE